MQGYQSVLDVSVDTPLGTDLGDGLAAGIAVRFGEHSSEREHPEKGVRSEVGGIPGVRRIYTCRGYHGCVPKD